MNGKFFNVDTDHMTIIPIKNVYVMMFSILEIISWDFVFNFEHSSRIPKENKKGKLKLSQILKSGLLFFVELLIDFDIERSNFTQKK